MDLASRLESERRTRLATERILNQTKTELGEANRKLALHARDLTTEVIAKRAEAARVRSQAKHLQHEVTFAQRNLERAESAMVIAERRLWDSLEAFRDGFAVFSPDNNLIVANQAYLAMFDGLEMVRPGVNMAILLELMAEEGIVDLGGTPASDWQSSMLARLDEPRIDHATIKLWNEQYIQFIDRRTRDGDLVTLALNITEQTRRETLLREAMERAEAANRAKSAFLANMSHEIRTPMNGVVAMAELLSETTLDDEQRSYLETIRSSGEALLVIINDVLDYSKIEADKIEFKKDPFDFERCVHDVVTLLQPGALDKGLQLTVDFDLFLPRTFYGDAGRIRQIFTNLIGNALKFTEEGHVLVRILGLPGENDEPYQLHITVEDTGIGIPKDKLESIFKEFQQVENEHNRGHDGTGLGLAITEKLVREMGGDIWVDSVVGEGTGFGFSLPLQAVDEIEPEELKAPDWIDRAIVLDTPGANRDVLAKQLGVLGLEPVVVDTPGELQGAAPGQSDVVFIDANAVEGDAFEFSEKVKSETQPGGMFLLVNGPTKVPDGSAVAHDVLLNRPILRSTMMNRLADMTPPGDVQPAVEAPDLTPRQDESVAATASAEIDDQAHEPDENVPGLRRMRILAAEDNKTNRFVFEKMLKGLDVEITFAENGLEAIEAFEAERPDIIFTDISMPKMDGKEATRRIRAIEEERGLEPCPIIAITAHAMEGDADDILAAGVDRYLTKPLKKQALFDEIIAVQPLDARPALRLPDDGSDLAEDARQAS